MRQLIVFSLIVLTGCNGSIYFSEPQPSFSGNIQSFPDALQGIYFDTADSGYFKITKDCIISFTGKITTPGSPEADSLLIGDLYNYYLNKFHFHTDTVIHINSSISYVCNSDTLLKLDSANVLRKYRKYYFINTLSNNYLWSVAKLWATSGDTLVYGTIEPRTEIEKLKKITKVRQVLNQMCGTVPADSTNQHGNNLSEQYNKEINDTIYILQPSKREFKKIINGNFFTNQEKFLKIKINGK